MSNILKGKDLGKESIQELNILNIVICFAFTYEGLVICGNKLINFVKLKADIFCCYTSVFCSIH